LYYLKKHAKNDNNCNQQILTKLNIFSYSIITTSLRNEKKKHIYMQNEYKIIQLYNIQVIPKNINITHLSIYIYVIY
jgi:hypothetical protein